MAAPDYIMYAFLLLGAIASVLTRKLTIPAAITGSVVGLLIYKGAGYPGIAMLAAFFILGSWSTGWRIGEKQAIGSAEGHKGQRKAGQVIANGGVAALLGAIIWLNPSYALTCRLMIAGSLAAATADTLSSELGTVYGRNFYNIITFKKDQRGLDGVVSLEGTLIGMLGAALIALIYALSFNWSSHSLWIVVAGAIGNLADSVLGATLERKKMIGNNSVNFLNTLIGAMVCLLLLSLF